MFANWAEKATALNCQASLDNCIEHLHMQWTTRKESDDESLVHFFVCWLFRCFCCKRFTQLPLLNFSQNSFFASYIFIVLCLNVYAELSGWLCLLVLNSCFLSPQISLALPTLHVNLSLVGMAVALGGAEGGGGGCSAVLTEFEPPCSMQLKK